MDPRSKISRKLFLDPAQKSWIWILDSQHYCLEIFKSERLPDLRFSSLDLACQSGSQRRLSIWKSTCQSGEFVRLIPHVSVIASFLARYCCPLSFPALSQWRSPCPEVSQNNQALVALSVASGSQSQAPDSLQSLLDRVMAGEVQTACGSKAFGCDGLQY